MSKGIVYVMSTVVPGLVKIGQTGTDAFENRMYNLEHNGYNNVVGLHREFAIEVEDYDKKEKMLHDIFSKSQVGTSELFSIDLDLVLQLLSSFEGRQVFPAVTAETKEEVFIKASEERSDRVDAQKVPDGTYFIDRKIKRDGNVPVKAQMEVSGGNFIIRAGQRVSATEGAGVSPAIHESRVANVLPNGIVIEDVTFTSPSAAGCFAIGAACDGWKAWKTADGKYIDVFR